MAHGDLSLEDKELIDGEINILNRILQEIEEKRKKQLDFKKDFATTTCQPSRRGQKRKSRRPTCFI